MSEQARNSRMAMAIRQNIAANRRRALLVRWQEQRERLLAIRPRSEAERQAQVDSYDKVIHRKVQTFDTPHKNMRYYGRHVSGVAKAVRQRPGIGGDVRDPEKFIHVAEKHTKRESVPVCVLGKG